jgi:hypothetical protein
MAESLESTFFQAQWPIWWRALRTFVSCMLFAVLIDQSGHLIPCVGQSEMIWHPCQVLQRSGYMYSGQHTLQSMKIPAGDERVGVVCEQRLGSTRSPLHFHLRCPMPARCFRRGRLGGRRQATSTELGSLSKWIRRSRIAIKDVNWYSKTDGKNSIRSWVWVIFYIHGYVNKKKLYPMDITGLVMVTMNSYPLTHVPE